MDPGRENCAKCDPRHKIISAPEKARNNLLLNKQLSFKEGRVIFRRDFKQNYPYLSSFHKESLDATNRLGERLKNYPAICQELDYKFEVDIKAEKLMFLPEYLKSNNVQESDFPRMGKLPLILAVSYSKSTEL